MNLKNNIIKFLFIIFLISFFYSCNKPNNNSGTNTSLPMVTTVAPKLIANTIQTGGTVVSMGIDSVTEVGICYSELPSPTIASKKIIAGSGNGPFTSIISPILANTNYYIKAYAKNSAGIAYGDEQLFQIHSVTIDSAKFLFIGGATTLYCFDAQNGNLKWSRIIGSRITSSPCYENGLVFSGCEDGKLYCYDTSGTLKWSAEYGKSFYNFTPSAANGMVYINNDSIVYGFNGITGNLQWQYKYTLEFYDRMLSSLTFYRNTLYASGPKLVALDAATGKFKWSFLTKPIFFKPKIFNSKVYVLNEGLAEPELLILDVKDGNVLWKKILYYIPSNAASINVANGLIYLNKGGIIAMDTLDGSIKWKVNSNSDPFAFQGGSSPVVVDGFLHNVRDNYVSIHNATTGVITASNVGTYGNYDGGIHGTDVTVVNGFSYYGTRDIFNLNTGRVRCTPISENGEPYTTPPTGWQSSIRGDFNTTPCVVTASGKAYRAGDEYY